MITLLHRAAGAVTWVSRALGAIGLGVAFVMVGMVVYGAVMRYVFRLPTAFSIEAPQVALIIMIAFCVGYAQVNGKHVRIDLLVSRFPTRVQKGLSILSCLVTVGYGAVVLLAMWQKFMRQTDLSEVTIESRIPLAPFSLAIIVGILVLVLQVVADQITGRKVKHRLDEE